MRPSLALQAFEFLHILGWRNNLRKAIGPARECSVLGVLVDTVSMTARVTPERIAEILSLLNKFPPRRDECTLTQLRSLIGKLTYVSKCVVSARAFLRRSYGLLGSSRRPGSTVISLTPEFHSDMLWWKSFLVEFNGVSLLSPSTLVPVGSLQISCDASDVAAGAVFQVCHLH